MTPVDLDDPGFNFKVHSSIRQNSGLGSLYTGFDFRRVARKGTIQGHMTESIGQIEAVLI